MAKAAAMSQSEADWILKAMIAMAAADERLDAREVNTIQRIYQAETGRAVDARAIVLAVQVFATRRHLLEELAIAAGSMSQETKEAILRAACLTAQANEQVSATESAALKALAAALQISEDDLQEIVASAGPDEGSE